jgi:hypothetical protein
MHVTNEEQIAIAAKQCKDVQIVINNADVSQNWSSTLSTFIQ